MHVMKVSPTTVCILLYILYTIQSSNSSVRLSHNNGEDVRGWFWMNATPWHAYMEYCKRYEYRESTPSSRITKSGDWWISAALGKPIDTLYIHLQGYKLQSDVSVRLTWKLMLSKQVSCHHITRVVAIYQKGRFVRTVRWLDSHLISAYSWYLTSPCCNVQWMNVRFHNSIEIYSSILPWLPSQSNQISIYSIELSRLSQRSTQHVWIPIHDSSERRWQNQFQQLITLCNETFAIDERYAMPRP